MAMEWTDELIARLKELWEQGLSTAEIGRQLSITKNAVVGKAHRLGLPPRPSPIRNKAAAEGSAKPARTRTRKAEATSEAVEEKAASAAPAKPAEKKKAAAPKVVKVSPAAAEEPAKPASVKADRPAGAEKPAKASAPKAAAAAPAENPKAAEPAARPAAPVAQRKVAPPRRVRDTIDRTLRQGPTCQWPLGDPGTPDFHFCGATPLPGKPYCAEHAAIAYVKIRDRRH